MAKKTIKKPKAKLPSKKTVKEKAKPTPKSQKETKREKPNTIIELKQDV